MGKQGGRDLHGGELLCWAFGIREATASGGRESGSEVRPMSLSSAAQQWTAGFCGLVGGTHCSSGEKSVGSSKSCFTLIAITLQRETVSSRVAHFYGRWAHKCASIWA